jgi:hypothetical protein
MNDKEKLIDALIKMRDSMEYVGICEGVYFDQEDNMINAEKVIFEISGKKWAEVSQNGIDDNASLWNGD